MSRRPACVRQHGPSWRPRGGRGADGCPAAAARVGAFSARILERRRLWWSFGYRLWQPRPADLLARIYQHYALRSHDDPERRWRRGAHWQRALNNKWNSREFARRHGCRVPDLYWRGWMTSRLDFDALPRHYVLRPVIGHFRSGVYVVSGGCDLLRGRRVTPGDLRAGLRRAQLRMGFVPVLAEAFVRTEAGEYRLPLEYSIYSFAGVLGAIEVKERLDAGRFRSNFYTAGWEPFAEPMKDVDVSAGVCAPPRCLAEMIDMAGTLGAAYGSFVRVDCFATDRGAVFGEFSSVPTRRGLTPFAEEYFGELWRKHCPAAD